MRFRARVVRVVSVIGMHLLAAGVVAAQTAPAAGTLRADLLEMGRLLLSPQAMSSLATLTSLEVSTAPLGTSTGGFTFTFDPLLRTFGARTVVVAGISLNVGIPNVVMDLANRGYEVVVPRDACAGVPASYEDQVIEHTIKMLASVTTTARLVEAWRAAG